MPLDGNKVLSVRFEEAHGFSEGLTAVMVDGKVGYIDNKVIFVLRPQLDDVPGILGGFSDVMAQVRKDGQYGYVDKNGFIDKSGVILIKRVGTFGDRISSTLKALRKNKSNPYERFGLL